MAVAAVAPRPLHFSGRDRLSSVDAFDATPTRGWRPPFCMDNLDRRTHSESLAVVLLHRSTVRYCLEGIAMLHVKMLDEVVARNITTRQGQQMQIRSQFALIKMGDEVRKCRLNLGRDQPPHPAGDYVMVPSFKVNPYGELELAREYALTPRKS